MAKFALTLQSKNEIAAYAAENHLMRYEREILSEILTVVEAGDTEKLTWFAGFGDSYRQILMNVNEHRRALEFGFTEIAFNKYGWFDVPKFLDFEEIALELVDQPLGHLRQQVKTTGSCVPASRVSLLSSREFAGGG